MLLRACVRLYCKRSQRSRELARSYIGLCDRCGREPRVMPDARSWCDHAMRLCFCFYLLYTRLRTLYANRGQCQTTEENGVHIVRFANRVSDVYTIYPLTYYFIPTTCDMRVNKYMYLLLIERFPPPPPPT